MIIKSLLVLLVALPAVCLFYLSPIYKPLDCPKNEYAIGTTFRYITGSPKTDQPRELLLQIWYPIDYPSTARKAAYFEKSMPLVTAELQAKTHLPDAIIKKLLDIPTCSHIDSFVSNKNNTYPVVIFPQATYNTRSIEYIVSAGYIVVNISSNFVREDNTLKNSNTLSNFSAQEFENRVQDIEFTFDKLAELNEQDKLLKNKFNLDKVAFMGHSFNGVAALSACRENPKCKAAINLDGSLSFDPHIDKPIGKPVLMLLQDYEREAFLAVRLKDQNMTKQEYLNYKYSSVLKLCQSPVDPVYTILIKQAGHDSFTDALFLKYPLANLLGFDIGQADAYKLFAIINNYIIAFLDRYLKDELVNLPSTCTLHYANVE